MDCGADTKNTLKASWVVGQEYFNALAPSNRMTLPGPVIGYISTALHHSIFDSVIAKPHYARNFLHHWENEMRGIWFPTRCTNKKYLQWSCVVNENLWRIIFTVILWKTDYFCSDFVKHLVAFFCVDENCCFWKGCFNYEGGVATLKSLKPNSC